MESLKAAQLDKGKCNMFKQGTVQFILIVPCLFQNLFYLYFYNRFLYNDRFLQNILICDKFHSLKSEKL